LLVDCGGPRSASDADAPSTTTERTGVLHAGPATTLTTGYLGRSSPDGSAVFVEAVDPTLSQTGCEGQAEPIMFRAPMAGGDRVPVLVDGATVGGDVVRGPGGRVALVDPCEEFVSDLTLGTEAA